MADDTRKFLLAANTSGVGVMGILLRTEGIAPDAKTLTAFAAGSFVIGLAIAGLSLFRAKDNALKRRSAIIEFIEQGNSVNGVKEWPHFGVAKNAEAGKWLTDRLSFGFFVAGVIQALIALGMG